MFSVDIVIPTYNRKKFSDLISHNINIQTYPYINKILIGDDGDEELQLNVKYPIEYYKMSRCSIGTKRNELCLKSKATYIAFMDTDDFYHKDYITMSILNLMFRQKSVSGSADMILSFKNEVYMTRCIYLDMLNEATMVFTRKYFEMHKFKDTSTGEAIQFIDIKDVVETDINLIMVCICHESNTIDKKAWCDDKYKYNQFKKEDYAEHFKILSNII